MKHQIIVALNVEYSDTVEVPRVIENINRTVDHYFKQLVAGYAEGHEVRFTDPQLYTGDQFAVVDTSESVRPIFPSTPVPDTKTVEDILGMMTDEQLAKYNFARIRPVLKGADEIAEVDEQAEPIDPNLELAENATEEAIVEDPEAQKMHDEGAPPAQES